MLIYIILIYVLVSVENTLEYIHNTLY